MSLLVAFNYLGWFSILVTFVFLSSRRSGNLAFVGLELLIIRDNLLCSEFLKADPLARTYLLSILLSNVDDSHSRRG